MCRHMFNSNKLNHQYPSAKGVQHNYQWEQSCSTLTRFRFQTSSAFDLCLKDQYPEPTSNWQLLFFLTVTHKHYFQSHRPMSQEAEEKPSPSEAHSETPGTRLWEFLSFSLDMSNPPPPPTPLPHLYTLYLVWKITAWTRSDSWRHRPVKYYLENHDDMMKAAAGITQSALHCVFVDEQHWRLLDLTGKSDDLQLKNVLEGHQRGWSDRFPLTLLSFSTKRTQTINMIFNSSLNEACSPLCLVLHQAQCIYTHTFFIHMYVCFDYLRPQI